MDNRFTDIIQLIKQSRTNAIRAVNAELINLYWNIGEYISRKIELSEWGDSVVTELEISWSHNLAIFSRYKTGEEREFYLNLAKKEHYNFRELDRQISVSLFERTMIGNSKLSTVLRENNQELSNTFKDS